MPSSMTLGLLSILSLQLMMILGDYSKSFNICSIVWFLGKLEFIYIWLFTDKKISFKFLREKTSCSLIEKIMIFSAKIAMKNLYLLSGFFFLFSFFIFLHIWVHFFQTSEEELLEICQRLCC